MEEAAGGGSDLSLFRTHPLNEDRVAAIRDGVRQKHPELVNRDPASFESGANFRSIVTAMKQKAPAYADYDRAHSLMAASADDPAALAKAETLLRGALGKIPAEPLFLIALGEIDWQRKKYAAAVKQFDSALVSYQGFDAAHSHWKIHFYKGLHALEQKQAPAAQQELRTATQRFPAHPEPHYFLGSAFELGGQVDQAAGEYQAVLELTAEDSPLRARAQGRLEALGYAQPAATEAASGT
jgi:predicted Zn-dependent protease